MADAYFSLEIGERFIKLTDAKKKGEALEIISLAHFDADPTFYVSDIEKTIENQATIIRNLISSNKINKKNVAVVIPDSATYTQILLMPRLNEKELISAIRYQADQFIPLPIEQANIDIEILTDNQNEKKINVLIVAAARQLIEKIQNLIELSGLIPYSVENEVSSTGRFLSEFKNLFPSQENKHIIIVNFGYNSTSLYLFDPHHSLIKETHNFKLGYHLFLKEIEFNTNYDLKRCQELLKLYQPTQSSSYDIVPIITPVLKEFNMEFKRFLTLVKEKHQSSISHVYVINEVSQFPAIVFFIEKTFSLPTKELNPYNICFNNPLTLSHKNDLPLFISNLGANLR